MFEKKIITIKGWLLDREKFTVQGMLNDGTATPVLDLRPLFQQYHDETS